MFTPVCVKSVRDRQGVTLIRFFFFLPPFLWAFCTTWSFSFNFPFWVMFAVISYLKSFQTWLIERFLYFFFIPYSLFQRSTRQYSVPSRNSSYSGSSQKVADQSEQPVDNMSKCINKQKKRLVSIVNPLDLKSTRFKVINFWIPVNA